MTRTGEARAAYREYLDGKRSLDSVLDLADHMRDFLRGRPGPGEGGTGPQPSPIHEAYQRCLDGELPLDEMLALADRYLTPRGGGEL